MFFKLKILLVISHTLTTKNYPRFLITIIKIANRDEKNALLSNQSHGTNTKILPHGSYLEVGKAQI